MQHLECVSSNISPPLLPFQTASSVPSANWVMLVPDLTVIELSRGGGGGESPVSGDSNGGGTANTDITSITTISPEPASTGPEDSPFLQPSLTASNNFTGRSHASSAYTSNSASSSVDMESSSNADTWLDSIVQRASRFLNLSGLRESISKGIQESEGAGGVSEEEDEIIRTEPGREPDSRFLQYPFQSQEGLTIVRNELVKKELKDKFAASLCVRGSNSTPEPITSDSPRRGGSGSSGRVEESGDKPSHKRTNTWHSESQFKQKSPSWGSKSRSFGKGGGGGRSNRLSAYISTPRMSANLRVQPHPIRGFRCCAPDTTSLQNPHSPPTEKQQPSPYRLWNHERLFDVFVHPSTLPEVYHYLQKRSTSGAFLVEISSIPQPNKYVPKATDQLADMGLTTIDVAGRGSRSSNESSSSLPQSLVVRLCFATEVVVQGEEMIPYVLEPMEVRECQEEPLVSVAVKVGHVMVSDVVRRQLDIGECSRVKMLHVMDSWKMSFVDGIKVVVHPLNYNKVCVCMCVCV